MSFAGGMLANATRKHYIDTHTPKTYLFMKYLATLFCCALFLGFVSCKSQNKNEALRSYSVFSTLEIQLRMSYMLNNHRLVYLKKDVKINGNAPEGLERVKRAEILKKKVAYLIGNITKVKHLLTIQAGDGLSVKTHMPKQALEVKTTQSIMRKKSPELSHQLEKYVNWLSAEYKDLDLPKFEPLHEGSEGQNFYEAFFAGAHLGDVLIMLAHLQSEIMRYQSEVLKKLGGSIF